MDLGAGEAVGGFQDCLEFSGSAVLNPMDYVNGLAAAFVAKGGQIFEETRVRKPDNNTVTTMAGNQVSPVTENPPPPSLPAPPTPPSPKVPHIVCASGVYLLESCSSIQRQIVSSLKPNLLLSLVICWLEAGQQLSKILHPTALRLIQSKQV